MELRIGRQIAKAEIDTKQFRNMVKQNLDIKNAVNKATTVVEKEEGMKDALVKGLIYHSADWVTVFRLMADKTIKTPNIINVKLHMANADAKPRYMVRWVNEDRNIFKLENQPIREDVILISDFPRAYESALHKWLARDVLHYEEGKVPKKMVEL